MSINNGGPAFPAHPSALGDHDGMDLRDYFAAKVMQALMHTQYADITHEGETANLAYEAYRIADAMLKERSKK